ncbi:MAG: hypothetical protein K8Q89_05910 [Nitrosarchaeum sp.]|nr:hypothetical protein [Nitrosarchaeum sp.]
MKLEVISHYEQVCKEIMLLNSHTRFVKIINSHGRVITSAIKNNIEFFVNGQDEAMLYMEVALRTKMLGDFDPFLGPMHFSVYNRKNVVIMEFPIENATVYVSSEKEIDLNDVPYKILAVLRKENILNLV